MEKLLDDVSFDAPDLTDKERDHRRGLRRPHARRHRPQRRSVAIYPVATDVHAAQPRHGPRPRASRIASRWQRSSRALPRCGKKGPPLAPLNMAPEAPATVVARRLGDTVFIAMKVPSKSALGTGPYTVDHLEVYAVTLAPGAITPPNRDLLKPEHVIAKIPIAPPLDPEAPEPDTPETRPHPGDPVTFVEKLTPEALQPQVITKPPKADRRPARPPRPRRRAVPPAGAPGAPRRAAAARRAAGADAVVCRAWACRRSTAGLAVRARRSAAAVGARARARRRHAGDLGRNLGDGDLAAAGVGLGRSAGRALQRLRGPGRRIRIDRRAGHGAAAAESGAARRADLHARRRGPGAGAVLRRPQRRRGRHRRDRERSVGSDLRHAARHLPAGRAGNLPGGADRPA